MRAKILVGVTLALASGLAAAGAPPHVVIGGGRGDDPYAWMRPDGVVLKRGVSDAAGRAEVVREPGRSEYVLEMLWGRFRVEVADACWERPPEAFHACVRWGAREDSAFQREQRERSERAVRQRQQDMKERVAWVERSIDPARRQRILAAALDGQRAWMATSAAALDADHFECVRLSLAPPDAAAQAQFDAARGLRGSERNLAYARAAAAGHWRAAARLASGLLDDEDWEGSSAVVAWLLERDIPAGYNKLADLLAVRSGHDGARPGEAAAAFTLGLRWRAAQLGDPVAQAAMAGHFARLGRAAVAEDLQACARAQNPELG